MGNQQSEAAQRIAFARREFVLLQRRSAAKGRRRRRSEKRWLTGTMLRKREPGVYNAIRIARALGVTVEDLMSDEDIKGGVRSEQEQER